MPVNWSCTAARARYWGIRASLDGATSDLELADQKNPEGKRFIDLYCKPIAYKGKKADGVIKDLWLDPVLDYGPGFIEKGKLKGPHSGYQGGIQYCLDDGLAEMGIDELLPDLPDFEQQVWDLDFKMNTRGIPIDMTSVHRARVYSDYYTKYNLDRFSEITGGLRPTQRDKVLDYLQQREEIEELGDLRTKTLERLVKTDFPLELSEAIDIRMDSSRASIKKIDRMVQCTSDDGFARGLFVYGGAHTMRWSAKRIQPHNWIRGDARVQKRMFEFFEQDFWNAPKVGHNGGPPLDEMPGQPAWVWEAGLRFPKPLKHLSQSMRGFIKAPEGRKIVSGDYAQIEARKLPWFARCDWLLDAFREGKDVYVAFAAKMYGRRYDDYFDDNGKVRPELARERQIAKSAVLGCGFGLGARQYVVYCDNMNLFITEEEADATIKTYRGEHPEICDYKFGFWTRINDAAIAAVADERTPVHLSGAGISFHVHRLDTERYWLIMTLPSGRHMAYFRPKLQQRNKWGRTVWTLTFRTEWNDKSYREDTYGGKLTENAVQASARDMCAIGALNVERAGYPVFAMVHDEIISLPRVDFGSHKEFETLMCQMPACYTDMPVKAEGATMFRYGK